jgi:hypothetical protein
VVKEEDGHVSRWYEQCSGKDAHPLSCLLAEPRLHGINVLLEHSGSLHGNVAGVKCAGGSRCFIQANR